MRTLQETFTLANGVKMPRLGLGTWQIPDGDTIYETVKSAIDAGYRHIDTAHAYANENGVGRAVRDSGIPRGEIFVTSKCPAELKSYDLALTSFDATMSALGLEQLDLYLIHAPWPWAEMGTDYSVANREVWRALETIYASGRARAIGVSNFNIADLNNILEHCTVRPMVNQIRYFIGDIQDELAAFCKAQGVQVEGYSPLATGAILENAILLEIAAGHGKSVAQICIRYVFQKGIVPLPKSTNPKRLAENAAIDFELTHDEMTRLDELHDIATHLEGPRRAT